MRVFVAGATGVIGQSLIPSLVAAGHEVTGTTRSPASRRDGFPVWVKPAEQARAA
jgi:nucleoside-diphosphate-sugar epimerase